MKLCNEDFFKAVVISILINISNIFSEFPNQKAILKAQITLQNIKFAS